MKKNTRITDPVATLRQAIHLQSTSVELDQRDACCHYIGELLENHCEAKAEYVETGGAPSILATIPGESTDTILYYGHYDVMDPGDVDDWDSDPFTLTLRNGRYYGRGAGDNKGQLLAVINGLSQFVADHPNRKQTIQLLIEGEEEQGSIHLASTVAKLKETGLANVKKVIVCDGSMNASGDHVLRLANRGLYGITLHIHTADHANHSGNAGNVLANPVLVFQDVLNRLYDGQKVRLPHFYDGVLEPSKEDLEAIVALPFDADQAAEVFGGKLLTTDKVEYYTDLMFKPSFNVSGVESGYNGEGVKTIIPGELSASLNMRLVGHQDPDVIDQDVKAALKPWIESGVLSCEVTGNIPPSTTIATAEEKQVFKLAAGKANIPLLVEPCMPGTVPNYVWSEILKAQTFTLPLANFDQNNHSLNENITQVAFDQGIALIAALADEFEGACL